MNAEPTAPETPMVRIPKSANPIPTMPRRASRAISVPRYAGGALLLAVGLLLGAQQLGWYGTSGKGVGTEGGRVSLTAGTSIGLDVKGWMTVQDVLDAFPVTQDALYSQFAIPSGTPTDTGLGSLSEASDGSFDIPALREWLDSQL
jgi:hypothetical protein